MGVVLAVGLGLGGCSEKARPWSQGEGPPGALALPSGATSETVAGRRPGAEGEEAPGPPAAGSGSAGSGEVPDAGDPGSAVAPGEDPLPESRVKPGGTWTSCAEGLALSGDPLKDVTRLGLVCGPSNGMRRKSRQAIVGVVGDKEPPVVTAVRVARGACYRVFAVGSAEVGELEVTVRSSRDVAVARDHGAGRLAIVQADRPFCTFQDDVLSVEVAAKRGGGRFAAEVWSLGEPRKKGEASEAPSDEGPIDKP